MKNDRKNIAKRMAGVIVARMQECGQCNESDLWQAGFDAEQIRFCMAQAFSLAAQRLQTSR